MAHSRDHNRAFHPEYTACLPRPLNIFLPKILISMLMNPLLEPLKLN